MADTERVFLVKHCERQIAQAEKTLANFVKKLGESPVHAFAWGDSALKAGVEKELYSGLKTQLMNVTIPLETLADLYLGELMRGVNGGVSTSALHNAASAAKNVVTSDILGMLRSIKE